MILLVAISLLVAACSATGPTGSVAPSSVVVPTASPPPSMALATSAAAARVPVCNDRKAPWVQAANSAKDGPDPAGRIVFGQVSRADEYSQVVDPLFAIDPDGSTLSRS